MAAGFQLRPDVGVVVDLAVEDDPHGVAFVGDRLVTGGEVDDAEPAVTQRRPLVYVRTRVVWTTMREDVAHRCHPRVIFGMQPLCGDDSSNSTHLALRTSCFAREWALIMGCG